MINTFNHTLYKGFNQPVSDKTINNPSVDISKSKKIAFKAIDQSELNELAQKLPYNTTFLYYLAQRLPYNTIFLNYLAMQYYNNPSVAYYLSQAVQTQMKQNPYQINGLIKDEINSYQTKENIRQIVREELRNQKSSGGWYA